ncbi:MAG: ABC transporter ATP-binding protein [Kiloniellaceae bacterium]
MSEMPPIFELLDVEKAYQVSRPSGFPAQRSFQLKALDGVRLRVEAGSSTALVGESGSGKSTLLRVLLGLTQPTNGHARFRGHPIAEARAAGAGPGNGAGGAGSFHREVAMIYQDARGSLNPRMTVLDLIAAPLRHFRLCSAAEVPARVAQLLQRTGLPGDVARRYPTALSGGQIRRVAIARALAQDPAVLVADEAVSGLDVSTQAQLLNLLRDLQRSMGLTLLFITHDLGVASYLCEHIAIMYLGRIVEAGPTGAVLAAPAHPYARALRAASPQFFAPIAAPLPGEIPSPVDLPPGCRFAGRCGIAQDDCRQTDPALTRLSPARAVACLHPLAT